MIKAKQEGGDTSGGKALGDHPDGGALTVREGRFGPYVGWGKVFATIPKSMSPESVTLQDAIDLVNAKAAQTGKSGAPKKAAAKKTPAKKAAAKKPAARAKTIEDSDDAPFADARPAKKAVAKKATAKKGVKKPAAKKATAKKTGTK